MNLRLERILNRQQAAGFVGVQGAEASLTLPISDRLLNEILAEGFALPPQIREIQVHAHAGDRIGVRVKVSTPFIPQINLTAVIDRQPELPASAVLVLRLEFGGLLAMAGPALRFLDALPPGIRVEQDRLYLDLAKLALDQGLAPWLAYLDHLNIHTVEEAVVLTLRAGVPMQGPV